LFRSSSRDRLSCARSRDSRHVIKLEGKALVTPFGWNIKAESQDSARGPAAKPRPAAGEAQAVTARGTGNNECFSATVRATVSGTLEPSFALPVTLRSTLRLVCTGCRRRGSLAVSGLQGLNFQVASVPKPRQPPAGAPPGNADGVARRRTDQQSK
jgi:hypothetical protein